MSGLWFVVIIFAAMAGLMCWRACIWKDMYEEAEEYIAVLEKDET